MVGEIRLYIEGGGDSRSTKADLRRGYSAFLRELRAGARRNRVHWQVIVCGGRESAYQAFRSALRHHPDAFNVLLVDAEGPVRDAAPWEHLSTRDEWDSMDLPDKHCHLMVQTMEAWFIADSDAVARYFGKGFLRNRLPKTANVEDIDKNQLATSLNNAAKNTPKKGYKKIRDGAALLEAVDPPTVRQRAHHCERLFTVVGEELT